MESDNPGTERKVAKERKGRKDDTNRPPGCFSDIRGFCNQTSIDSDQLFRHFFPPRFFEGEQVNKTKNTTKHTSKNNRGKQPWNTRRCCVLLFVESKDCSNV